MVCKSALQRPATNDSPAPILLLTKYVDRQLRRRCIELPDTAAKGQVGPQLFVRALCAGEPDAVVGAQVEAKGQFAGFDHQVFINT